MLFSNRDGLFSKLDYRNAFYTKFNYIGYNNITEMNLVHINHLDHCLSHYLSHRLSILVGELIFTRVQYPTVVFGKSIFFAYP